MTTLDPGKVAVVTGGASGIGSSLARAFAQRGLRVVLGVHSPAQGDVAINDPALRGAEVLGVALDVSDANAVAGLMATTIERFGRVDIVCNNAGTSLSNCPLWESSTDDWATLIGVNVMGVVHGVRAFMPHLVAQGHGHVVNTSSMAGLTVLPGNGAYSATKHAVVALSETPASRPRRCRLEGRRLRAMPWAGRYAAPGTRTSDAPGAPRDTPGTG